MQINLMLKFLKENWFKLIIALCAVVVVFGYLWSVGIDQDREDRLTEPGNKILQKYGL